MSSLPLPIAAFLAGVLSFLSPCVLPLVPGYVSLISGSNVVEAGGQSRRVLRSVMLHSAMFIMGFSIVFISLGALATSIGQMTRQFYPILTRVAGVIIILAGLSHSVVMAAYGLGTYLLIQFLETHLVTPLVQERTVRLPPAATLGLQIVAGMLFGIPGIVFAVPATAAGRTLIQELYVEDYLGGGWYAPRRRHDSRLQRLLDRLLGEPDDL